MKTLKAYRTKLITNNKESAYFWECAIQSDKAYNWALEKCNDIMFPSGYAPARNGGVGSSTSHYELKRMFNAMKRDHEKYVSCTYVFSNITEAAIINLGKALDRYWKDIKEGTVAQRTADLKARGEYKKFINKRMKGWRGEAIRGYLNNPSRRFSAVVIRWRIGNLKKKKVRHGRLSASPAGFPDRRLHPGWPQMKTRRSTKSAEFRRITVENGRVKLPQSSSKHSFDKQLRVGPWFRLAEPDLIPPDAEVRSATVSLDGNDWYISILVREEMPEPAPLHTGKTIGIDVGARDLVTLSNGRAFGNHPKIAHYEKRIANLQRKMKRQQYNSNRWKKSVARLRKLQAKKRRAQRHAQHEASAYIVKKVRPDVIGREDLNIKGMMRKPKKKEGENGHYEPNGRSAKRGLSRTLANAGMGELLRQIEYKAKWEGVHVHPLNRFYPSSKTCSDCGAINDELGSSKTFICPACGFTADRDHNAAINIKNKTNEELGRA